MQATDLRNRLRARILEKPLLIAPGVADVLSAKLVHHMGFEALFLSGNLQHRMNGYPDVNVLSMPEMANNAAQICDHVALPVIADGENGFGYDLNVKRMIRAYERAGVSAIHIEDSVAPPVPAHVDDGGDIVSKPQFLDKIKTALDTREDGSLMIIARSESTDVNERADRLSDAIALGADAFWFSTHKPEDIGSLKKRLNAPGFGVLASGRGPLAFQDLGANCGVVPSAMAMAAVAGQISMLQDLRSNGVFNDWFEQLENANEVRKFFEA